MPSHDHADHDHDHTGYAEHFARVAGEVAPHETWNVSPQDFWCYVEPPGYLPRSQGWKIHVSATPRTAVEVLTRSTAVLVRAKAAFKFTKSMAQLRELVSIRCDRSAGGKFITVYPNSDEHFRTLVEELHAATEGLAGPAILSDRPYQPGSLVHYRYGGFSGELTVLDLDGSYAHMLVAPDGSWTKDERLPWFSPPEWARSPLPDTPQRKPDDQRGKPVLLDGRFVVKEAIRHANRGGVYRAVDETTGEKVIIKQARPHIGGDLTEGDATDFLHNEARMLELLAPLGLAPRLVSVFTYEGHTFLAEEQLDGTSLREWVDGEVRGSARAQLDPDTAVDLARQLVSVMRAVHDKNLVFRDFNPGNVLIDPAGRLRLIDTEFLATPGEPVVNAMTYGYAAPEQVRAEHHSPAPERSSDLYSLGGSLLYLCSAVHPGLAPDTPRSRDDGTRLVTMAEAVAQDNAALRRLLPIVEGLLAEDPEQRWTLQRVDDYLDRLTGNDAPEVLDSVASAGPATEETSRMLHDGLRELVRAATPNEQNCYPPLRFEGRIGDPCSVQAGVAGPIEVLRRAVEVEPDDEQSRVFEAATRWLDRRLIAEPRLLPGLYFGRAGSVWALYEAAVALGDEELRRRACKLANRLPISWENPDLTHGLAGSGMTQLHLWRRTGDEEFRSRTAICADRLIEACERRSDGVAWPIPGTFRSELGGLAHYGLAHGVAGVATFLLGAARALDRPDLLEVAVAAGEVLVAVAQRTDDVLRWPTGEKGEGREEGVTWWCSGSGGVGAFLIRLWHATGDARYRDYAHGAALAALRDRWRQTPVHCHGLAGGGELLLDMAAATGDAQYLDWSTKLTESIYARHTYLKDGLLLVAGEALDAPAYSYNLGLAGVVGYLHRARHGGPRWWMVDDFELPAPGSR